jgi:phage terminase large subunit-like protein
MEYRTKVSVLVDQPPDAICNEGETNRNAEIVVCINGI